MIRLQFPDPADVADLVECLTLAANRIAPTGPGLADRCREWAEQLTTNRAAQAAVNTRKDTTT